MSAPQKRAAAAAGPKNISISGLAGDGLVIQNFTSASPGAKRPASSAASAPAPAPEQTSVTLSRSGDSSDAKRARVERIEPNPNADASVVSGAVARPQFRVTAASGVSLYFPEGCDIIVEGAVQSVMAMQSSVRVQQGVMNATMHECASISISGTVMNLTQNGGSLTMAASGRIGVQTNTGSSTNYFGARR